MPAIITHDFFGHDVFQEHCDFIGNTMDEMQAFLLGNQGPDPFFYCSANPLTAKWRHVGNRMHHKKPTELLRNFKQAIATVPEEDRGIARAYALGFLCHYLLDSTMHPFVYWNQNSLCDAGIPGLSREDGSEVHAVIESEFDEMLLFTRTGETVVTFIPYERILQGSDHMLNVASHLHVYANMVTYSESTPENLFASCVYSFRITQRLFHSPTGKKRQLIGRIEELVRPHSFLRAMSHRVIELNESPFENRQHQTWEDPFTGEQRTESFSDLYQIALGRVNEAFDLFDSPTFGTSEAAHITDEKDFSGEPVTVRLISVE